MGQAGSVIADSQTHKLTPAELSLYQDAIVHGEYEQMADVFAVELAKLKEGPVDMNAIRARIASALKERHAAVAVKVAERKSKEALEQDTIATESEKKQSSDVVAAVHKSYKTLVSRPAHTFLVCVDGSAPSDLGFRIAVNFRQKFDHLVVFHSYRGDIDNSTLPPPYRMEQIQTKYETALLSTLPTERYNVAMIPRPEGVTAKGMLDQIIGHHRDSSPEEGSLIGTRKPDIMVIGYSGRRSEINSSTVLGSKTDFALRSIHIPVIIAKRWAPTTTGQKVIALAADKSVNSRNGLDILLTFVSPTDRVVVVHIVDSSADSSAEEATHHYFTQELQARAPVGSSYIAVPSRGASIVESLLQYVEEDLGADMLAIAPRGQTDITGFTEQIIQKSRLSIFMCKS